MRKSLSIQKKGEKLGFHPKTMKNVLSKTCEYRETNGKKCSKRAVTKYLDSKRYCNTHLQMVRNESDWEESR